MRPFLFRLSFVCLSLTLTCFYGCGPSYPTTVKIKVKVTLDGKPFPNARVFIAPSDGSHGALGVTDALGIASAFSTFLTDDGVVPGEHKVSINSKLPPPMPGTTVSETQAKLEAEQRNDPTNQTPPFPGKYKAVDTSELKITVGPKDKGKEFLVEMKSQ